MRLLDPNFKGNLFRYIMQCFMAMAVIFIVLLLDSAVFGMTVAASLGASAFIAFTMPHTNAARPRYLVGGYIIGSVCGVLMNVVYNSLLSADIQVFGHSPHIVSCTAAVGLTMFIMVITNFEHPPAAALSLGLVIQSNALITAFFAVAGVIIISVCKTVMKKWLRNLL